MSDVVQGPQFLLFALLTGPLYMLLWPAGLHLAFVFPYRLPALDRRPWLVPAAYLAGFGAYLVLMVGGWLVSPTLSEWLGTWPLAQLAVVVPLLIVTLAIFVRSYRRTTDDGRRTGCAGRPLARCRARVTTLALFWLPELVLGRPIVGSSWLGIVALFFPFGGLRDPALPPLRHRRRHQPHARLRRAHAGDPGELRDRRGRALGTLVEQRDGVELLATGAAALIALPLRDVLQRTVNRLMYGDRDEPWRAMHRLGDVLEWAAEPDRAFPAIVDTVADALRPFVALALVDADGTEHVVAERRLHRAHR